MLHTCSPRPMLGTRTIMIFVLQQPRCSYSGAPKSSGPEGHQDVCCGMVVLDYKQRLHDTLHVRHQQVRIKSSRQKRKALLLRGCVPEAPNFQVFKGAALGGEHSASSLSDYCGRKCVRVLIMNCSACLNRFFKRSSMLCFQAC